MCIYMCIYIYIYILCLYMYTHIHKHAVPTSFIMCITGYCPRYRCLGIRSMSEVPGSGH